MSGFGPCRAGRWRNLRDDGAYAASIGSYAPTSASQAARSTTGQESEPGQVDRWRVVDTLTTVMVVDLDGLEIAIQVAKIFPSCAGWVENRSKDHRYGDCTSGR